MVWAYIGIIVVSLFISAFVAGSETALVSINRYKVRDMVRRNDRRAKLIANVLKNPEDFFSAILLINNLVNILISTLAFALTMSLIADESLAILISTVVATTVIVILSEITPKTIAATIPERWAFSTIYIVAGLVIAVRPVTILVTLVLRKFLSLIGIRNKGASSRITSSELRLLIDIGEEEGTVEDNVGIMLENSFRFTEKKISDVMTPRPEIEWAYKSDTLRVFLQRYARSSHSRFPVLDPEQDDIIGVLSVKDVLKMVARKGYNPNRTLTDLMREPLFIPEFKTLDELFKVMRHSGSRLALAVDEFGSVSGIVTITRLVEQVVGDTGEEGADNIAPQEYNKLPDGSYLINAGMSIDDARHHLEVDIPEGDYDTVAGWFLDLSQRVPKQGDGVTYDGGTLKIAKLDGNRIKSIFLRKTENEG